MNVPSLTSTLASSPAVGFGGRCPRPNNQRRRRRSSSAAAATFSAAAAFKAGAASLSAPDSTAAAGAAGPRRLSVASMAEVVEEVVAVQQRRDRQDMGAAGDADDRALSFIEVRPTKSNLLIEGPRVLEFSFLSAKLLLQLAFRNLPS